MSNLSDFMGGGGSQSGVSAIKWPVSQGLDRLRSNESIIPSTTDFIKADITNETITKFNSSEAQLWTVSLINYGMNGFSAWTIESGVLYAFGRHSTGALIGWIEIDMSTGVVTNKFSTETCTRIPIGGRSFVNASGSSIYLYSNGNKYTFNKSTGAKTDEVKFSSGSFSFDDAYILYGVPYMTTSGQNLRISRYDEINPTQTGSTVIYQQATLCCGFSRGLNIPTHFIKIDEYIAIGSSNGGPYNDQSVYWLYEDVVAYFNSVAVAMGVIE